MGWFRRKPGATRESTRRFDTTDLSAFVGSRRGVEAYLEPRTAVTETTVLLIAHDGEWTRRRVDSPRSAARFATEHAIPLYEVLKVGYPQRMRDYNARQKILARRAAADRPASAES